METKQQFSTFLYLLILMSVALMLSYFLFASQSLRLDESQSLWQTSHSLQNTYKLIAEDVHVPLYHTLLHAWQFMLGNNVAVARLLSLVFFVASIPALYFLGKVSYSRGIGLFAATLLTLSPFMNWYGNEIRMYSLMTFLAILNHYFFVSIYKKKTSGVWWGYLITAIFGIYTHYFFWLILLTQGVFFFAHRSLFPETSLRNFTRVAVLLLTSIAPWILYVMSRGAAQNSEPLLNPPTSVNLFNTFSEFLIGFQNDHINTVFVSLWPLVVLLSFFALQRQKHVSAETAYYIVSIVLPIFIVFAISLLVAPVYVSRYLIFTVPCLYVILAWLCSTYPPSLEKAFRFAAVLLMLSTLGVQAVSAETPVKEDYKSATEYLNAASGPRDIIIVSAPFTIYPVEYYYSGPSELTTLPLWDRFVTGPIPNFEEEKMPDEVEQIKGDHEYVWLLLSYDQGYEEQVRLYFDTHFERVFLEQFSPGLALYKYKLRYDIE